jgi:hypothetical protein
MPLINLQTDLKSLSYNGNGPYVQKDLNNPGRPATDIIQGRVDDTARMLRLLGEKGVAFTAKQALLLAGTKGLAAIPQAGNILLNIIAQVPVNGTGTHFLPIDRNLYYTGVTDAAERSLQGSIVGGASREGRAFNIETRLLNQQSELGDIGENLTDNNASQYLTVGQTTDISFLPNQEYVKPTPAVLTVQLNSQRKKGERPTPIVMGVFNDTETLDTKYGFAESGKSDSINLLNIGNNTNPTKNVDDLVPIKFSVLGKNLANTNVLVFRGFLGSLSDRFSGAWNSTRYVGRGENFYTYDHFSRGITFNFQLPIFSAAEQEPVITKLNSLSSITAPTYVNNLAQGKITNLEVGSYLRSRGILTEVGITVANEVPWSYGVGGNETILLPQVYSISINFTPIHSKTPQYYGTKANANPFIAPDYVKPV